MSRLRTFILVALCASSTILLSQENTFMTYNIRYDNPEDGIHNWHERKAEVIDFLINSHFDILGIQEGVENQVLYLDEQLKEHSYVGVGRDDGKANGEYTALFYNNLKFQVLDSETFWLSTTPEKVSVGWDAALPRICTWARLRDLETNVEFMVFNTHFDHKGVKARKKAAKLIYRKITQLNATQLPVVLMGDLNLPPASKGIKFLSRKLTDPLTSDSILDGPPGTWFGFDAEGEMGNRIDYIFTSGFKINTYQHMDPRRNEGNHHLSDHLPVMAKLQPQ